MNQIENLYFNLRQKYGQPRGQWSLWCKRPKTKQEKEEVIIGAILTQRTNWKNVALAISNLKRAKIYTLKDVLKLGQRDLNKLTFLIKPSGFYKAKAEYLLGLAKFILEKYGGTAKMKKIDLVQLRKELLALRGIGPETADSILLYALEKPVFVIDEYTRRLIREKGIADKFSYEYLQKLFKDNLKRDFRLYQDFHALIVIDGKKMVVG